MRRLHGAVYCGIGFEPGAVIKIVIAADGESLRQDRLQDLGSPIVVVDGGREAEALAVRDSLKSA